VKSAVFVDNGPFKFHVEPAFLLSENMLMRLMFHVELLVSIVPGRFLTTQVSSLKAETAPPKNRKGKNKAPDNPSQNSILTTQYSNFANVEMWMDFVGKF
jgi:hypothetical protein